MTAVKPRIQNILKILLPTTFPIAISDCFLRAATTEVASSGRLVPTATTVSPIIASLIPMRVASSTAPSTIHFPQMVNPTRPSSIKMMDFQTGRIFISSGVDSSGVFFTIPKVYTKNARKKPIRTSPSEREIIFTEVPSRNMSFAIIATTPIARSAKGISFHAVEV